jgi:hypothetical protein
MDDREQMRMTVLNQEQVFRHQVPTKRAPAVCAHVQYDEFHLYI